MNKRGQIYLLAALIIGFILFIVITPTNIIKELTIDDRFEELSKNFEIESAKFINRLIEKEKDVPSSFLNFTILFTSYSKTKNPDFGLIYAFINKEDNKLYVGNYLPDLARFEIQNNQVIINGCFDDVNTTLTVAGLNFNVPDITLSSFTQCQKSISVSPSSQAYLLDITIFEEGINETALKFSTQVAPGNPELIIIAKEKKDNTRKIFTKGKFV